MKNVWTIAGADSSSGAGIQADLQTFQQLGVHGCSVITAVTAQHAHDVSSIQFLAAETISAQINALAGRLPATVIKIGMLGNLAAIIAVINFLKTYPGQVVLDPVMFASSGKPLFQGEIAAYKNHLMQLFPYVDLFTPNLAEAEIFLDRKITSYADMVDAAQDLISLGPASVVIKGGHQTGEMSQDYWTNGSTSFWLANHRYANKNYRGTGCVFASAVAASLALGNELKDALVIAKMYVSRGIRLAWSGETMANQNPPSAFLTHAKWPEEEIDLPYLSSSPMKKSPSTFPDCGESRLGLCPVVDSSKWIQELLPLGVKTIQLRIKNKNKNTIEQEIKKSVSIAKKYNARLFVNDYWELAISHAAYGVHLGQEDLMSADLEQIYAANLRLGISTHCYYEVARAHACRPSYIACGPIFPTTSKTMPFLPQGLQNLARWQRTLSSYPLVAIGGINLDRLPAILATGVEGIALISAITQADNPAQQTLKLLQMTGLSQQFSVNMA